jgi:thymidylate kinase
MKGQLLIFEGLDATGKSTIANKITQMLNGVYLYTPDRKYINQFLNELRDLNIQTSRRCEIILNGLRQMLPEIEALLKSGKTVILDRWKWTTLAYHFSAGNQFWLLHREDWQELLNGIRSGNFEFLIQIPNENIWQERLHLRPLSPSDRSLIEDQNKRHKILSFYSKLNPHFKTIDNSGTINKSIEQVLNMLDQ